MNWFLFALGVIIILILVIPYVFHWKTNQQKKQNWQQQVPQKEADPNKDMRESITALAKDLSLHQGTIVTSLEKHTKSVNEDIRNTLKKMGELNDIFKDKQKTGKVGEVLLKTAIEQVYGQQGELWEWQPTLADGKRPDALIKECAIKIPIDAKFPLEKCGQDQDTKGCESALKGHIREVSKYVEPDDKPFVVMYLPSVALGNKVSAEIRKYAQDRETYILSHGELAPFLRTVRQMCRRATFNQQLNLEAREIKAKIDKLSKTFKPFDEKWKIFIKTNDKHQNAIMDIEKSQKKFRKQFKDDFDR